MHALGAGKRVEAEFGLGEVHGTLVLTTSRVIFVCTDEREEDLRVGVRGDPLTPTVHLLYSDVEDLSQIPDDPRNVSVRLGDVTSAKGHKGEMTKPSLELRWKKNSGETGAEFVQVLTGRRRRNLNDWAGVISGLNAGTLKLVAVPEDPSPDTLEGKVAHVLSDMQEKGIFAIGGEVEAEFGVVVGPDEVQSACEILVKRGVAARFPDQSGDVFYRKLSALGEPSFSS